MKTRILLLAFLLLATALSAQIPFMQQPDWNDVLRQAKKENKFIFLDAYTEWCSWCKTMDKNTFPDSAVVQFMNKHFVCVKMEMETDFGVALAMKYRVFGFPSFLVFAIDGRFVGRMLGYKKPDEFIAAVNEVLSTPQKDYPKGITGKIELPFPDFYRNVFIEGKRTKNYPDTATVLNFLAEQEDLSSEVAWSVLYRFNRYASRYDDWIIQNAARLKELYGAQEVENVFNTLIGRRFQSVVQRKDEAALQNEIFPLIEQYMPEEAAQTKTQYKISYYSKLGEYARALGALKELKQIKGAEFAASANELCWNVYEKCNDENALHTAALIMEDVTEKEPEYAYLDTYAALLFKIKDYAQAEKFAGKAIEQGKKENQDVKETEQLLAKIKEATAR